MSHLEFIKFTTQDHIQFCQLWHFLLNQTNVQDKSCLTHSNAVFHAESTGAVLVNPLCGLLVFTASHLTGVCVTSPVTSANGAYDVRLSQKTTTQCTK